MDISIISVMLVMPTAGCASKKAADASASPALDSAGAAGDELAALEQQLTIREAQLRATGIGSMGAKSIGSGPESERDANDGGDTRPEAQDRVPSAPARAPEPAPMAGTTSTTAPAVEGMVRSGGLCEQVCEIAAAICTLEQQICGLVARHPDDARYQAACERAAGDCKFATEACHACN